MNFIKLNANLDMNLKQLLDTSKTIWLSTHKSSDGDGLGSEVAFYHALNNNHYNVKIIHNDPIPQRYHFLIENLNIHDVATFHKSNFTSDDIIFIFDTHDPKLCAPLFDFIQEAQAQLVFVDHHIIFEEKLKNVIYHINEEASCTGEIVLNLIKKLNIPINESIATALYTSLLFDTQCFRFQREPLKTFDMAQELIRAGAKHKQIYSLLFDNWSLNKMNYLSKLIKQVIYKNNDIAIINIVKADLESFELNTDDVSDLVDLFMSIRNLNCSIVVREDSKNYYKLSFRSRSYEILSWAREFGGGGHLYSAGAWVNDTSENILNKIYKNIDRRK